MLTQLRSVPRRAGRPVAAPGVASVGARFNRPSTTAATPRRSMICRANTASKPANLEASYLKHIREELEQVGHLKQNLHISDVTSKTASGEEFQWVDLVMAGGGLLGIAHVGFVCVLEKAGIRFRSVGGTSAGAINAMVVAAVREDPTVESWVDTLQLLTEANFSSFQDGDDCKNATALIKRVVVENKGIGVGAVPNILGLLGELRTILRRKGIHPGIRFQDWVRTDILAPNNIKTLKDLRARMNLSNAGLTIRESRLPDASKNPDQRSMMLSQSLGQLYDADLRLVASDITTQTKAVFPDDARLYYKDPDMCDPSGFVRASMSVPGFFQPFEIANIPKDDPAVQAEWQGTGYDGEVPAKVTFVDGGTLSNFPISLFDTPGEPILPTIGCQLGRPRGAPQGTDTVLQLVASMNNTSRHIEDYDFLIKNPVYKQLVAIADTTGFNWLDFDMADDKKRDLFRQGARAGRDLLVRFQGSDTWNSIRAARRARHEAAQQAQVVPAKADVAA